MAFIDYGWQTCIAAPVAFLDLYTNSDKREQCVAMLLRRTQHSQTTLGRYDVRCSEPALVGFSRACITLRAPRFAGTFKVRNKQLEPQKHHVCRKPRL